MVLLPSARAAPLLAISPVKALTLSWPSDLPCACREPPFTVPKSPSAGIWRKRRRGCASRSAKVRGRCSGGSCSQVCICRGSVKSGHAASSTPPGVSAQSSGAKRQLVTASPRLRAEPPLGWLLGFVPFLWPTDQTLSPVQAQLFGCCTHLQARSPPDVCLHHVQV